MLHTNTQITQNPEQKHDQDLIELYAERKINYRQQQQKKIETNPNSRNCKIRMPDKRNNLPGNSRARSRKKTRLVDKRQMSA